MINKVFVNRILYTVITVLLSQFMQASSFIDKLQRDYIINYAPIEYFGGGQIWCIEKDNHNNLFLATNKGLSVFDGNNWRNYSNGRNITLRWLYFDSTDNKLYCASDNEFGYWKKNKLGQYTYVALYRNENLLSSEIFWRVFKNNDILFFQTSDKIYSYDQSTGLVEVVLTHTKISYMYQYNDQLYVQIENRIFKYNNISFEPTSIVVPSRIIDIVALTDKTFLVTEDLGLIEIKDDKVIDNQSPANRVLRNVRPFSVYQISKNEIAIGSVLDGVFVINQNAEISKHFNFTSGLKHSTVLSINTTNNQNLWLGLDGGLAKISNNPSEIILTTQKLDIGTVYNAVALNNHLYVGTNKGLFVFNDNKDISFIEGTQGQVWDIVKVSDKSLILCHDAGLFQVDIATNRIERKPIGNLWKLIPFDNNPNILLGLDKDQFFSIYEFKNNTLLFKHKLKNIEGANTDAVIDRYGDIWIQDRENNPVRIKLNSNYQTEGIKRYGLPLSKDSLLLSKIDGDIVIYNREKACSYDIASDSLIVNQHYTSLISEMQFFPREINQVDKNTFFYASDDKIAYIKRRDKFYDYGQIFQNININQPTPFTHKIIHINNDIVATGVQGGVVLYFMKNEEQFYRKVKALEISQIEVFDNNKIRLLPISQDSTLVIGDDYKDLRIYFTNLYPNKLLEYKIDEGGDWKLVNGGSFLDIPQISYGKHSVFFRNVGVHSHADRVDFVIHLNILRPWYFRTYTILLVIVLILVLVYAIRFAVKRKIKREHKKIIQEQLQILEKEKKDFDYEVLQMRLYEEEKKMISLTMESVKYNAILNEIKNDTVASHEETKEHLLKKLKNIMKSVDYYLKKEDPNKVFEKYFNAIHDGFYDRLTKKHPNLTQNEAKLCAYIKLNLSTKEIAIHTNIAPSSVEVARYRLRKKINLDSETNLQEYIQSI